jgi:hypothetical protein
MALDDYPSVFMTATVSLTTLAASGDPLLAIPTRDALVFLAKARGLPMADVARALNISHQQAQQLLAEAQAALDPGALSRTAGD